MCDATHLAECIATDKKKVRLTRRSPPSRSADEVAMAMVPGPGLCCNGNGMVGSLLFFHDADDQPWAVMVHIGS